MQIDNPQRDEVWFWYDPTADAILQEEVESYRMVGVFETESSADRFIHQYAEQYELDYLAHLEKYRAD